LRVGGVRIQPLRILTACGEPRGAGAIMLVDLRVDVALPCL
jgi:hypothetical protein